VAIAWAATIARVPLKAEFGAGPDPWRVSASHGTTAVMIDAVAISRDDRRTLVDENRVDLPRWSTLHLEATRQYHRVRELGAGWPLPCLRYVRVAPDRSPFFESLDYDTDGAIAGRHPLAALGVTGSRELLLPYRPIWFGLVIDAALLGLAWLIVLRLPYPWRFARAVGRVRRQRCPTCHYDLRGIESDRCPECGGHRYERPPLVPRGVMIAATMLVLMLAVVEIGLAGSVVVSTRYEPIHRAAYEGDLETVRRALDGGVALELPVSDEATPAGMTPLWLGAAGGHADIVIALAERGADVSRRSAAFGTPVDIAAQRGHVDVVRALHAHGAAVDAADAVGVTPLMRAARAGEADVIEALLVLGANATAEDAVGATALHRAAERGRDAVIERLLDTGADPARTNDRGETPLAQAIERGHASTVLLLLEHGVEPDTSAIVEAVRGGRCTILEQLIAHGADLDAAEARTAGLLFHAPFDPAHRDIWRLLVEHGAEVNARSRGRSVLMVAARRGSVEFVRFLLEHGADPTLRDRRGRTALDHARGAREQVIRDALERAERDE
jgi:ankyrin repeat protein